MKKSIFTILYSLFAILLLPLSSFASTIYLPSASSDQYLPTVKIHAFSLDYEGNLTAESLGSGTLIDDQGTILTNNHVIQNYYDETLTYDAFQICLTKSNDTKNPICEFSASLIERNPTMDIALLKMNDMDVRGNAVDFSFFLPYENEANPQTGDKVTVLGYPDIGGKTVTVTEGIISGSLDIEGLSYLKTDADISFGNSGGTTVDQNGNLIGVPTYVSSSYSAESLGYFLPITTAAPWITENINKETNENKVANEKLRSLMISYITANESGTYQNKYPSYAISVIDGWKFGNSLEAVFDSENRFSQSNNEIIIYPKESSDNSALVLSVYVSEFGYNLNMDDIAYLIDYYSESDPNLSYERVKLNDYDAIKETTSYEDYYSDQGLVQIVSYDIPYGDKLVTLSYSYLPAEEAKINEIEQILSTFTLDLSKISFEEIYTLTNTNPEITVSIPEDLKGEMYLIDGSYEWDGQSYFGASFNKKREINFTLTMYTSLYSDSEGETVTDLNSLKKYLDSLGDNTDLVSQGTLKINGHNGFYYTYKYDYDYYDKPYVYTSVYIALDANNYLIIYYSGEEIIYTDNFKNTKKILQAINLAPEGKAKTIIPNFLSENNQILSDIKNHVYEENIKNLYSNDVLGENLPETWDPEGQMNRREFVTWVVKSLTGDLKTEFDEFEKTYAGCENNCFEDVDYNTTDAVYIAFAQKKEAVGGITENDKKYLKGDHQLSLVAALKILFEVYGYDVWDAPDMIPWYLPYLQLAYKEWIMPYGVSDISYMLKRGEAAYVIDLMMQKNTYYEDDYYIE